MTITYVSSFAESNVSFGAPEADIESSCCMGHCWSSSRSDSEHNFASIPLPQEDLEFNSSFEPALNALRRVDTSRTLSRRSFIQKHYDVLLRGREVEKNLRNAEEYILCDDESEGHRAVNALFINFYAQKTDAVMVESIPRKDLFEPSFPGDVFKPLLPEDSAQSAWLQTPAIIVGWDIAQVGGKIGKISQNYADLDRKTQILLRKLLNPKLDEIQVKIKKELIEVIKEKVVVQRKMLQEAPTLFALSVSLFPIRVESMMKALDDAKGKETRTFLMASPSFVPNKVNEEESLDELYKFFRKRKVAVLIPKPDVAKKLGAEREEILLNAASKAQKYGTLKKLKSFLVG